MIKKLLPQALTLFLSAVSYLSIAQNPFDEQTGIFQLPGIEHEGILGKRTTSPEFQTKSLIALYDSLVSWEWDTLITGWKPDYKQLNIVYDDNNNRTNYSTQLWNDSVWENYFQYNYTYNANNNLTYSFTQGWDTNTTAWVNLSQTTITRDVNNNITNRVSQSWINSTWENSARITYTYDANNNLTHELWEDWNVNAWQNDQQWNSTFDVNNNLTIRIYQRWNGSAWVNSSRGTSTYDVNNNVLSSLSEYWSGSAWLNSYFTEYTYDINNNLSTSFVQEWISGNWMNRDTSAYTYDVNNNLANRLHQKWDVNTETWVNYSRYNYTYNTNNSTTYFTFDQWLNNAWEMNQQEIKTYDANNFLDTRSFKFWHNQGTFISSGDSTRYYFQTVIPVCYAGFVLYPDTAIEHNWFVLATGSGDEPISYFWEWGDGTTSTGANPSHTYSIPGYYNICMSITDANGCTDTYCDSSTYVFKTGAEMITVNVINHVNVGIEEETVINSLLVYPNPASNSLTIETATTQGIYQLQDLTGKQLLSGTITATKFSLYISTLSKGIYLLTLIDGEQVTHKKIVKE